MRSVEGTTDVERLQRRIDELEREVSRLRSMADGCAGERSISPSQSQVSIDFRAGQSLLRALMDHYPAEITIKDKEGRFILLNRCAEESLAVRSESARGLTPHDFFPPSLADAFVEHDRQVLESGKTIQREFRFDRGDAPVNLLTTKFPLTDESGEIVGLGSICMDVSCTKEQEEALRRIEALYKETERLAGLGHWEWDEIDDSCSYCSEELARLHGLSVEGFQKIATSSESDSLRVHPDDRERYLSTIQTSAKDKSGYTIEYRIQRPDHRVVDVKEVCEPVFDDHGRHVRSVGYVQDITEHKQTQKALQESRQRFKDFADVSSDWQWETGPDLRFRHLSADIAKIAGASPEEFLGKSLRDFANATGADRTDREATKLLIDRHEPVKDLIVDLVNADGKRIHLALNAKPILDENDAFLGYRGTAHDVTETTKMIEALWQGRTLMRQAEEMAGLGHWVWDEALEKGIYCSEGLARLHGISPANYLERYGTMETLVSKLHPDDRDNYVKVIEDAWERGVPYEIECREIKENGQLRYYRESGAPVIDENGTLVRTVGTLQDITAQKRIEGALRESESLFKQAAAMGNLGHWVWDEIENRMTFCSEGLARLQGLTPDQYLERFATMDALLEDIHPDDRGNYRQTIEDARKNGSAYEIEFRDRAPNGEYRYYREHGEPVFDESGSLLRTIGILQDITEQKHIEEALRESESLFKQAAQLAGLGHWVWDEVSDALAFVSEELARICGFTAEQYCANFSNFDQILERVHPEDRAHYEAANEHAWAAKCPLDIEYRYSRPDGEVRYFRERGEPIFDEDGRHVRTIGILQDITKDKLAEEVVRRSEAAMAEAQRVAKLGHWQWSIDADRLVSCSEEYAAILGLPRDELAKVGERLRTYVEQVVHPEDRRRVEGCYMRADSEAVDYDIEYRIVRQGGETRHVHEIGEVVRDAGGRAVARKGTLQDITERKVVEESLRQSEEKFRVLIEGSIQGILIHRDNKPLFANDACAEIFGYANAEEFVAAGSLYHHVAPKDRRRLRKYYFDRLRGLDAPSRYVAEFIHRDGSALWLEIVSKAVSWDSGPAVQATLMDVTEQKLADEALERAHAELESRVQSRTEELRNANIALKAEIEERERTESVLRERERLIRAVTDALPSQIAYVDKDQRYRFNNLAYEKWFGIPSESCYGRHVREVIGAENYDNVKHHIEAVLRGETVRFEYKTSQGRVAEGLYLPDFDERGDVRGFYALIHDITDIKKREKELRQAHKMEAIGQLTGGIAHDFNNLLFVVRGNLALLEREFGEHERARRMINSIEAAVGLGSDLTKSLLAYSRQQSLEPTVADLGKAIEGTVATLLRTLGNNIRVDVQIEKDVWPVLIDRSQFETALLNLALNARDAMPNGGTLEIAVANRHDPAASSAGTPLPAGDYVELRVTDNGVGMTAEVASQSFEPFITTKPSGSGTGLGLSMVYGFINQSGGYVDIESEVGKGTTLRILLPRIHETPSAALAPVVDSDTQLRGTETILVTEDDDAVRRVAVELLASLGYRIFEARDANEAVRILEDNPNIDLLFTDVILPGKLDGPHLARLAQSIRPGLKVLFVTGYSQPGALEEFRGDGSGKLMRKPYEPEQLALVVRRELDRDRMRRLAS
jgi:PAS domain S-box-containing protein